jgi:NAD-dependent deacetylase
MRKKLLICSGAGLSAESGIQTFRDANGLWENHSIDEVCNINSFLSNYIAVNDFYNARRLQLSKVDPNYAHNKIAELSEKYNVKNFTTNVDDLLERAGCKDVLHMHGILTQVINNYEEEDQELIEIGYKKSEYENLDLYPVKPNVVFFGQAVPLYDNVHYYISKMDIHDKIIVIGSSEQVFPFVINAKYISGFKGEVIFVNPDKTLCDYMKSGYEKDITIECKSATDFFKTFDFELLMK